MARRLASPTLPGRPLALSVSESRGAGPRNLASVRAGRAGRKAGDEEGFCRSAYFCSENRCTSPISSHFISSSSGQRIVYLVNRRLTDTLRGTKVLLRNDYEVLARERGYYGTFDPFGDFDLVFGAAKQNLKIIEAPIYYKDPHLQRNAGFPLSQRLALLKIVWFACCKLKASGRLPTNIDYGRCTGTLHQGTGMSGK
jgi:hypothetical protein